MNTSGIFMEKAAMDDDSAQAWPKNKQDLARMLNQAWHRGYDQGRKAGYESGQKTSAAYDDTARINRAALEAASKAVDANAQMLTAMSQLVNNLKRPV